MAPPTGHCWECKRRRLVCDSTRPACTRCQIARVNCPGYSSNKPLRWVRPGQVSVAPSRRDKFVARDRSGRIEVPPSTGTTDEDPALYLFSDLIPSQVASYKMVRAACYCKLSIIVPGHDSLASVCLHVAQTTHAFSPPMPAAHLLFHDCASMNFLSTLSPTGQALLTKSSCVGP